MSAAENINRNSGAAAEQPCDAASIRLHWVTAALVVALWGIAQIIDLFPRGPLRIAVRSTHTKPKRKAEAIRMFPTLRSRVVAGYAVGIHVHDDHI